VIYYYIPTYYFHRTPFGTSDVRRLVLWSSVILTVQLSVYKPRQFCKMCFVIAKFLSKMRVAERYLKFLDIQIVILHN